MDIIFDQPLFEKAIEEVRLRALSLNESQLNARFNKYPKHVFEPLHEYLNEAFLKGLLQKGKAFADKFVKGAKDIATKVASAVKEFSFKKVFATVAKMMQKIKSKVLKALLVLLAPLREVIIKYNFATEDNKFDAKTCFKKLVETAKEVGKDAGAPELLNATVVASIGKNINLTGTEAIREGKEEEAEKGRATFDEEDVKYMDFFQKMLTKLGVKDAKINGFFAEIAKKITQGAAITGVLSILGALLPSMGIVSSIAAAAGAAVAAAPVLVMIIGAILFGIGLFMFATWLLKPYPTIQDCETFLATIFAGAHPFDFPDATLGSIETKPMDDLKPQKPIFNTEVMIELEREGVEEDIPGEGEGEVKETKDMKDLVNMYDDLDIDTLEDPEEVSSNIRMARKFVRNIFTQPGRDTLVDYLNDEIDENESDYAEVLQDLVSIVDKCAKINNDEKDEDGKKLFPFALNAQKVQDFLRDKKNTAKDRITKVIDIVDNFIDRIDKATA
jgi:hypothetical protein